MKCPKCGTEVKSMKERIREEMMSEATVFTNDKGTVVKIAGKGKEVNGLRKFLSGNGYEEATMKPLKEGEEI